MKRELPQKLEAGRVRTGPRRSDPSWGPYGLFRIQGPCGAALTIIASGADDEESCGWEHVSVSTERRCPNWAEMNFVKGLLWSDDELVVQFHPPKADYVNNHPFCLHLWRPVDEHIRLPPSILVGLKDRGVMSPGEAREAQAEIIVEMGRGR